MAVKSVIGYGSGFKYRLRRATDGFKSSLFADYLSTDTTLSENTDLKQLDLQAEQLKKTLVMQKFDYLPTLSLTGLYQWSAMNNDFKFKNYGWNPYSMIGITLSVPIFSGGSKFYKVKQTKVSIDQLNLQRDDTKRNLQLAVKQYIDNMNTCMKMLGVKRVIVGDFPNIKMNISPHLELVQFIEEAIVETGATTIITHHPSDLNNDHVQTSIACQVAVRLFQRRTDVAPLKELLFMEVLSSTEWALNSSISAFRPNTYIEVGKESIDIKIKALGCYRGVMRPYPHPRSEEAITGLAAYRGAISGCNYAESF